MEKNYIRLKLNVKNFIYSILAYLFPNFYGYKEYENIDVKRKSEYEESKKILKILLLYIFKNENQINEIVTKYYSNLNDLYNLLKKDIISGYEGDPAAKSKDEIILCYPGFFAISVFRLAHPLYEMGVDLLPRLMTEYAHSKTGIDIHPGATIGESFFIDHGTGVVIGETSVIGNNVKLYQNVTIGAKSFKVNDDGSLVKGIKRHPNIGNNVIIYAGATILGGDTFIGDNCVIGGNSWVTKSVESNQVVKIKM